MVFHLVWVFSPSPDMALLLFPTWRSCLAWQLDTLPMGNGRCWMLEQKTSRKSSPDICASGPLQDKDKEHLDSEVSQCPTRVDLLFWRQGQSIVPRTQKGLKFLHSKAKAKLRKDFREEVSQWTHFELGRNCLTHWGKVAVVLQHHVLVQAPLSWV